MPVGGGGEHGGRPPPVGPPAEAGAGVEEEEDWDENRAPGPARFNLEEYGVLRQRVAALKVEERRMGAARAAETAREAGLLQRQREEMAEAVREHEARAEELKGSLADALDRSARMRQQFAKERRGLESKVEKLEGKLEQVEAAAREAVEAMAREHGAQLAEARERAAAAAAAQAAEREAEIRRKLQEREDLEARLVREYEDEIRSLKSRHLANCREVLASEEGWRRKAVEGADLAEAVRRQLEATAERQQRAEEEGLGALRRAEERAAQAEAEARRLGEDVASLRAALAEAEGRAAAQAQTHRQELEAYKAQKNAQLDQVHAKVQGVLARRDATIAQLRDDVTAARRRAADLEASVERALGED